MTLQRNHYEVLGVPRKATSDEIKKKYRELARQFHPDISKDKDMGQKIFSQINQAYHVLGDADRRAQYDASLAADDAAPTAHRNGATNGAAAAPPLSPQTVANFTRLLGEAETAMLQNNAGKVKSICDLILKTDPRNLKALTLLGDALVSMGRPQEAIAAYRQALQVTPSPALQAKLNRLVPPVANGNGAQARPTNGTAPRPTPPAPTFNGNGQTGGHTAGSQPEKNRTDQGRVPPDQGRTEKAGGGLLSRLLGKK